MTISGSYATCDTEAAGDSGQRAQDLCIAEQWEHAGCGLPPGPSGLIGAAEGFSYVTLLGIAGWGIGMRATTSRGLPSGSMRLPSRTWQLCREPWSTSLPVMQRPHDHGNDLGSQLLC